MKKYEKELLKFCEETINEEEYKNGEPHYKRQARGWMFGAILFSLNSGLIDMETKERLLKKYVYI